MFKVFAKAKPLDWLAYLVISLACILALKLFVSPFDLIAGNLISDSNTASIREGTTVSQPFISNKDGLTTIQVLFLKQGNPRPEDAVLYWKLFSGLNKDVILAQGEIPIPAIKDASFYTLKFDPISNSSFNPYILSFSSALQESGLSIASSAMAQSEFYSYQINDQSQDGTIAFYTGYLTPDFNLHIILQGLSIAVILWLIFLFREYLIAALEKKPLHITVTAVIICFGLLLIIVEPPLHMFDEPQHFRRVWEISTGKLLPSNVDGVVSTQLPQYIQNTLDRVIRSANGTTQNPAQITQMLWEKPGAETQLSETHGLISSYSFLAYLLPALFVRLGVWSGSSALGLTYLVRLANLLQFTLLTYWALKHAKFGRQTIATVALLGLVLTQGVAINVDSLMMSGSFLFLASTLNLIYSDESTTRITRQDLLPLIAGAAAILISKHIYIPILGLVILIPDDKFGGPKEKWKWVFIFLFAAGFIALALQMIITPGSDPRLVKSSIDPMGQIRFILGSPVSWLRVFSSTMIKNGFHYYNQFNLLNGTCVAVGDQNCVSIGVFSLVQLVSILFFSWAENDFLAAKVTTWHRALSLFIIWITAMFVALPLYIYWSPVGDPIIDGLQGRYFLPLGVLALLLLRPNFSYQGRYVKSKLLLAMTCLLIIQVVMTRVYFY